MRFLVLSNLRNVYKACSFPMNFHDCRSCRSQVRKAGRRGAPTSSGPTTGGPERRRRSPSVTPSRPSSSPTGDRLKPEDILDEFETLRKEVVFFRDALEHRCSSIMDRRERREVQADHRDAAVARDACDVLRGGASAAARVVARDDEAAIG